MDKYSFRDRHYHKYFKFYMLNSWRIIRILRYNVRFYHKYLRMLRRSSPEYEAALEAYRVGRGELKQAYDEQRETIRTRFTQIRRNGREYKRWYRWRKWLRSRMSRRRARKYRNTVSRSSYWAHRFSKLAAGDPRWTYALDRLKWYEPSLSLCFSLSLSLSLSL